MNNDVLLVRQGIYDASVNVIGYELLFKRDPSKPDQEISGHKMTAEVLLNTFTDAGLENVIGTHRAFINFPKELLLEEAFISSLPRDRVMIEILESVEVDANVVSVVQRLAALGYQFALDDFVYSEAWDPLIEVASVIKFDVLALSEEEVRKQFNQIKNFHGFYLAEKVENQQVFDHYKKMGFRYFQGYFLSRPNPVEGKKVTANQMVVLNLLSQLQNPDCDIEDLEKIISQDSKMSFKLLKIVNSVAYSVSRKVESLKEAVIYLGLSRLRSWAMLLTFAVIDNKPPELLHLTVIRAKMCSLLAEAMKETKSDIYFTAGLFSTLDALLDQPLSVLLNEVPLEEDLVKGLLEYQGKIGQVLKAVIAYEQADWAYLMENPLPVKFEDYREIYLKAITWAKESQAFLQN